MLHWRPLVGLTDEQLATHDIALVNLACAADLPGAEGIDQDACAFKLDYWSRRVRQYTEAALPNFRRKRWDYRNSEGYFRALCMITVLQRDLGVRYNPAKIPEEVPLEVADTFVHGAILGEGGTCASLPVLYVAVGRRLGYPLKLATTRVKDKPWGHLFVRWDDPAGERFNIEGTNRGLTSEPDDYYRTGIFEITPEQEEKGCLLRSLTPRQELAGFLAERGHRWLDTTNWRRATESFSWALALYPENRMIWNRLCWTMDDWNDALKQRIPHGFPILVTWLAPTRRFPASLPFQQEKNVLYLEAVENMLNDRELDAKYWEPMRRRSPLYRPPAEAHVRWHAEGCSIVFETVPRPRPLVAPW
jgi:hypothetical protein